MWFGIVSNVQDNDGSLFHINGVHSQQASAEVELYSAKWNDSKGDYENIPYVSLSCPYKKLLSYGERTLEDGCIVQNIYPLIEECLNKAEGKMKRTLREKAHEMYYHVQEGEFPEIHIEQEQKIFQVIKDLREQLKEGKVKFGGYQKRRAGEEKKEPMGMKHI